MNSFWSVFLYVFWIFAFVAFLMILFTVLVDLFRDQGLSGWAKALWVIFLLFLPGLAILVYLIARGRGMAERNLARHATVAEDDTWGQHPTQSATQASDIQQAQALLDQGVISSGEFDALRAKALGQRY